ncbi:hypothetical protein K9N68_00100 [Kovacikia minuta CCNUW1]|uniref:hypothetical protein n=1 Tax=Kovacikia minuta TaxID=2931930 RepID=UPI001CCA564D|nr:hypothetical protein [Kovacikia minuta]UBF26459.1 hypothetical protein K9N68_00100 [Kovacikia minuta CCNUW1]
MANVFRVDHFDAKHHANIAASLAHRLEVARASNNFQLVKLLEQERWQIEGGTVLREAPQTPLARLRGFWQRLVSAIADADKLQVWQTADNDIRWWNAYDPHTGKSVCTESEAELRQWIEENYRE